jgi:hypothetical protein
MVKRYWDKTFRDKTYRDKTYEPKTYRWQDISEKKRIGRKTNQDKTYEDRTYWRTKVSADKTNQRTKSISREKVSWDNIMYHAKVYGHWQNVLADKMYRQPVGKNVVNTEGKCIVVKSDIFLASTAFKGAVSRGWDGPGIDWMKNICSVKNLQHYLKIGGTLASHMKQKMWIWIKHSRKELSWFSWLRLLLLYCTIYF